MLPDTVRVPPNDQKMSNLSHLISILTCSDILFVLLTVPRTVSDIQ